MIFFLASWRKAHVVLSVGTIAFTGGTLVGAGAAVLGGWQERAALRFCEFFITVPTLIIALTAAAIFGLTPVTAGVALGLAGVGPTVLLAHSLSRRVLEQPFIHAAHALGVQPLRTVLRHLLPNILPLGDPYRQSGRFCCLRLCLASLHRAWRRPLETGLGLDVVCISRFHLR